MGAEQHHPGQLAPCPAGGRLGDKGDRGQPFRRGVVHAHPLCTACFVSEDAPEFARDLPEEEWVDERDPGRIAQLLNDSAHAVRDAG